MELRPLLTKMGRNPYGVAPQPLSGSPASAAFFLLSRTYKPAKNSSCAHGHGTTGRSRVGRMVRLHTVRPERVIDPAGETVDEASPMPAGDRRLLVSRAANATTSGRVRAGRTRRRAAAEGRLVTRAIEKRAAQKPICRLDCRESVSGTLLPPCNARFEPQDANRLWHIGSHIWSTI